MAAETQSDDEVRHFSYLNEERVKRGGTEMELTVYGIIKTLNLNLIGTIKTTVYAVVFCFLVFLIILFVLNLI